MEKEQMDLLKEKFEEAYKVKWEADDVEWKEMGYGKSLAYLKWSTCWRLMKQVYPDANYRVIETIEANPLWNVNGYGFVKVGVSALGVEHIQTFPIMDNRNNAMKINSEKLGNGTIIKGIDGRDVSDSIQRALVKACAMFGIGLAIYEGKIEKPKDVLDRERKYQLEEQRKAKEKPLNDGDNGENNYNPLEASNYEAVEPHRATEFEEPTPEVVTDEPIDKKAEPATPKQISLVAEMMKNRGIAKETIQNGTGVTVSRNMTKGEANTVIRFLNSLPRKSKEPSGKIAEDNLPF